MAISAILQRIYSGGYGNMNLAMAAAEDDLNSQKAALQRVGLVIQSLLEGSSDRTTVDWNELHSALSSLGDQEAINACLARGFDQIGTLGTTFVQQVCSDVQAEQKSSADQRGANDDVENFYQGWMRKRTDKIWQG
jgi:hypothetical protein